MIRTLCWIGISATAAGLVAGVLASMFGFEESSSVIGGAIGGGIGGCIAMKKADKTNPREDDS
ncbi:MAG: hypothetical protein MK077_07360 [Phycisphaerales bacterium]|nr:hypothetical protein [Phycisphaerales bacterium]